MSNSFVLRATSPLTFVGQKGIVALINNNPNYNVIVREVNELYTGLTSHNAGGGAGTILSMFAVHKITSQVPIFNETVSVIKNDTTDADPPFIIGRSSGHANWEFWRKLSISTGFNPLELSNVDWSSVPRYRDKLYLGSTNVNAEGLVIRSNQGFTITYKDCPFSNNNPNLSAPARVGVFGVTAIVKDDLGKVYRAYYETRNPENYTDDSMFTFWNTFGSGRVYTVLALNVACFSNDTNNTSSRLRYARVSNRIRNGVSVPIFAMDSTKTLPVGISGYKDGFVAEDYDYCDGGVSQEQGFQADITLAGQTKRSNFTEFGTNSGSGVGDYGFKYTQGISIGIYPLMNRVPRAAKNIVIPPFSGFACQNYLSTNLTNFGKDYEIVFTVERINPMQSSVFVN